MTDPSEQQPELLPGMVRATVKASQAKAKATRARKAAEAEPAAVDPVARVLVDVPLAHLDRPFDYAVPAAMADAAVPGARVKVRFAGQDVDGFVVERAAGDRPRRPARAAAPGGQRRAGARARRSPRSRPTSPSATPAPAPTCSGWPCPPGTPPPRSEPSPPAGAVAARPGRRRGRLGRAPARRRRSSRHLAEGGSPRAVWAAAPGTDWPLLVAHAVAAAYASGRGALVCVPDGKDVARVDAALTAVLGAGHHVALTADAGPGPPLPRLPRRQPRRPAGRGRHPRRRLRAGPRPRAWW